MNESIWGIASSGVRRPHNLVCVMEDAMEMGSAAGRMNWLARSIHTTVPRGDWRAASSSEGKKKKKTPEKKRMHAVASYVVGADRVFLTASLIFFFFFGEQKSSVKF